MMGTELDELGEFDTEFIDNIRKFEYTSKKYVKCKEVFNIQVIVVKMC